MAKEQDIVKESTNKDSEEKLYPWSLYYEWTHNPDSPSAYYSFIHATGSGYED